VGSVLLSIVLGLFAPVVAFMGAEAFEVPGQNPVQERVAGSLAAALYLAICQFSLTPRESRKPGANWPSMVALGVPLLVLCFIAEAKDLWERALMYGPIVISGWLGVVAGALVAARVTLPAVSLRFCRRFLLTCAALLAAVALVVAAGVVPPTNADTFPQAAPERAVPFFWKIVVLNLLVATSLVFIAVRAGDRRRLSPIVLGFLAFLAFVPACFLAASGFGFLGHGPAMRIASVLLLLCSAAEFLVTGLVSATALLLPGDERA